MLICVVASQAIAAGDNVDRITTIVGGGRYMERAMCAEGQTPATSECCQAVQADNALLSTVLAPYAKFRVPGEGYQGLQDCRYKDHKLETRVIMLNPTPRRVGEWTITACSKASAVSLEKCASWLWSNVLADSGTQFAVTGPIVEPNATNCWSGAGPQPKFAGYTFRDGVTVRLQGVDGVCDGDASRLRMEPSLYFEANVVRSTNGGPSRVTMMTRQDYRSYFGGSLPGRDADANGAVEWLKLVREAHMQALLSTDNLWLDKIVVDRLPKALRTQ